MGKYKKYPEYVDSGLEWFGDIPSDWDVWKWKHTLTSPMTYGANEAALDDDVKNPRYIRITDMNADGSLRDDTFKSLQPEAAKNYLLKDGDILVARTGATVGKSFLYKNKFGAACFAGYLIRARINQDIVEPEFFYWYLQSDQYWKYISSSQIQATLQNVSAEKYGDMAIAIPSKKQDRISIANFLNHETAKIDTLIEKQQQLIQLLKEKRQAVISHAVTKGLNPNAPMKDSGVEWLGDVPEHWGVSRIKNIVSIPVTDGPHETPNFIDDGVPFVSAEAVSSGEVDFNKIRGFISEEANNIYSKKYSPKKYDIYMVKSGATTGVTAIVETDDVFNIWSPLAVIRCGNNFEPYFVLNFMRSEPFQEAIKLNWSFGTQQNIGMGVIENLHVTCPPKSEAETIAKYLQNEDEKFKSVVSSAYDAIQLMQERRTALISAAVTGKIDVRNWQAPQN